MFGSARRRQFLAGALASVPLPGVSEASVRQLIERKTLPAKQIVKLAP